MTGAPPRLLLADSVTEAVNAEPGALLVTGSHGGASVVPYALRARPALAVFNDAGIGLDEAGIAALALLQAQGVAACAVAHDSARIGEARSSWETGVVSRANALARGLGLVEGRGLREQVQAGLKPGATATPSG